MLGWTATNVEDSGRQGEFALLSERPVMGVLDALLVRQENVQVAALTLASRIVDGHINQVAFVVEVKHNDVGPVLCFVG
jgi:hypothetical protein